MTPEEIDQLWTEHEHAVAQQRQDREDLAAKTPFPTVRPVTRW
jgi:hypothetical protein